MKKVLIGLLIALAAASFFLDQPVLRFAESIQHEHAVYFMSWFSHIGTLIVVLLFMTSFFMFEEKKTKWIKVVWLSFLAAFIITAILKPLFGRLRPAEYAIGAGFMFYSFPSAHTAIAFSLIPVLDREFPKLKWFWLAFAVFIGASRIYLGAHYLSDVVFGAVLGYLIGKFFVRLEEKKKLEWMSWRKIHH
ncbi:phosphatase PAP2 family protein [Candidatus Woesearchaeota archaeon]|nr:phosphatase PAP2 family protein [Candidatus Woesearchaeota archaeon]